MASADAEPRGRHLPTVLVAVLGLLGFLAFCAWLSFPASDRPYWGTFNLFTDLHVYRWGGDHVLNQVKLYPERIVSLEPGQEFRDPMTFTYTPFAAVAFVPLALMGIAAMEYFWLTGSLLCAGLTIWWMFRWLGYAPTRRLALASAALTAGMLFIEPVRTSLWFGQINLVLLALLTYDAAAPHRRRLRGIGTGIAAGIKLTPAFMWAHFLVTKQFRALVVSVATFVATIAVGAAVIPRDSWYYWTGGMLEGNRVGLLDLSSNQSVNGMLAWYVFHTPEPPLWGWLLGGIPTAVIGLAGVWALYRAGWQPLAFVLAGMTGAMVSPFSWGHHWVWFIPLFVVLVDVVARASTWAGRGLGAGLIAVLYAAVGAWIQIWPAENEPDGVWVATGWFMNSRAFEGPLSFVFREPYLLVWAATMITVPLIVRFARRSPRAASPDRRPAPAPRQA